MKMPVDKIRLNSLAFHRKLAIGKENLKKQCLLFWQNDTKCRWEFPHELLDNKGHIRHIRHIRPDLKGFSPNQFPQLSALKKKSHPKFPFNLQLGIEDK